VEATRRADGQDERSTQGTQINQFRIMKLIRTLGVERAEVKGRRFRLIYNDAVIETQEWEENQVDMICTSIPFGTQYEYCPSLNDFGHNPSNEAFFEQMDFLVPELLRVLKPGRVAAIHVKDRIQFGNVTGFAMPTVEPFSDHTTAVFTKHGFKLMARITIDTDVVRENNQTYRLGWSENAKDGTKMGAGMPEYVLVFRKLPSDLSNGYADVPVTKAKESYTRADWQLDAAGLWRSAGDRLPDPDILKHMGMEDIKRLWVEYCGRGGYDFKQHVTLAKALEEIGKLPSSFMLFPPISRHPDVWTDIVRMRTLNSEQARRNQEKHVCPLQLDIIERLVRRYSMEGETVYDPFMGIGSVAYQALKMKRRTVGTELNEEYWRFSVGYAESVEAEMDVPTLFDMATAA
jgi:DNA modification methylase